ncbi:MAG: 2'-5' RNA ligase family protein [Sphingopyxis sp.]|nr:2'-5' RNA ligase family protein [Sphingopyxis sp.]
MSELAPLIVTAALGTSEQRRFDALRRMHFPPERNHLSAHLTLFHHLPPARADELLRLLKAIAADNAPPPAMVSDVYSLGRGVAFRVDAPALLDHRDRVAEWFAPDLTAQDQARPRLHITVQNKVEPPVAKALLAQLRCDFEPTPLAITGFAVHYYRGGPWELLAQIPFRGKARASY